MKIHEYNEMMSYLTRPAMKTGGQVIGKAGGLVEPGVTYYGAEIYRTNKGYGPEVSTERNVKKGFIYPKKNQLGEVLWSQDPGGTTRPIRYDFTKKAPIPEMDTSTFKFDIAKNKWVYLSRAEDGSVAKPTSHIASIVEKSDDETFKQFIKRITGRRDEGRERGRKKKIDAIVDTKNKVDDWTTKWLDENLDKYGIRKNKQFSNDLKKDYKKFVDKTFKTRTVSGINLFSLDDFPNVSRSLTETLKPYEYGGIKTVNLGKFGGPTQRLTKADLSGTQTKLMKNPVKRIDNIGYFKRIFFKNSVEKTPGFLDDLKEYFNYITTNKRTVAGREAFKNFIPNKDVVYFLDSNKSGLHDAIKGDVMVSLGDEVKLSYDNYKRRVNAGLNWVRNSKIIEETLGPKEMKRLTGYEKIETGMDAEQRLIKKIFDFKDLPKDLKLGYAIDHGQGISFAARSGDKAMMRLAVTDLIGSMYKTNDALGRGVTGKTSFERQRKTLANKIREGDKVDNNLNKLNKLIEKTYGTKNVYSIKHGNLVSSQISPTSDMGSRFTNYFEKLNKTKEGKAVIKKQYGSLENLKSFISKLKIKPTDNQKVILNKIEKAPIPNRAKALLLPIVAGTAAITGVDLMTSKLQAAEPGQMPQGSPGQLSEDEEGGIDPKLASAGAAGAYALRKPIWKHALKPALKTIGAPAVGLGFAGWTIADNLAEGKNIADAVVDPLVGIELMFPEVVKQLGKNITPKNVLSKILSLKILDKFPYAAKVGLASKIVRNMTPVGAGLTTAGLLKDRAINMLKEGDRMSTLEGAEQEQAIEDYATRSYKGYNTTMLPRTEDFNQGGRVGFAKGPKDPKRRLVLKGITALATLPLVGRFFKVGKLLERGSTYTGPIIEKIKGMPDWVPLAVKRLWNEGEDVTKTMATNERQIVKGGTLESGDDVHLIYQKDTGDVRIDVTPKKQWDNTGSGAFNKEYGLELKKGEEIATKKGAIKTSDEFKVTETEPIRTGHPEDPDWDWDWTDTTVDDAITDLTELEAFATKKTTKQLHKKKGTKKKDVNPEMDYDDSYDPETGIHYLDD